MPIRGRSCSTPAPARPLTSLAAAIASAIWPRGRLAARYPWETPAIADERVLNDVLNEAVLGWEGHHRFGRCDRHWLFPLTFAASGHGRLRGLPQSVRQAFSPVLAVNEQGDGLADAPLAGVGALSSIDVIDLIPLHAFITRRGLGFRRHATARPSYTGRKAQIRSVYIKHSFPERSSVSPTGTGD
jgi:hypothetical protein